MESAMVVAIILIVLGALGVSFWRDRPLAGGGKRELPNPNLTVFQMKQRELEHWNDSGRERRR